jgi:hypothetical protein
MKTLIGIFGLIASISWIAFFMWMLDNEDKSIQVLKILAFVGHIAIGYAIAIYLFRKDLWDKFIRKK